MVIYVFIVKLKKKKTYFLAFSKNSTHINDICWKFIPYEFKVNIEKCKITNHLPEHPVPGGTADCKCM